MFKLTLRTGIRIHIDRNDFTIFIHQTTDVNVSIINKIRKNYRDTDSVMVFSVDRFETLNDYHAKQLLKYLN